MKCLAAIISVAIITNNFSKSEDIIKQILTNLPLFDSVEIVEANWILSRYFLLGGNLNLCKGFLSRSIHMYPWKAECWLELSMFLGR